MDIIRSRDNSKIKYIRSLYSKKNRDTDFVVEGIKFVREAVNEDAEIKFILLNESSIDKSEINDILEIVKQKKVEFYCCDDNIFETVSETINSQGILAVLIKNQFSIDRILDDNRFIIMCDRIQDPGNLGTIIRNADAFGPAAVIMNKGCVDVYNSKVVRAAAGALFRVSIVTDYSNEEIVSCLRKTGFKIISTVVNSCLSFDDIEKTEKICVVIGNEGQGVSKEILEKSDMNITIEMTGRAESLNASVAAGICIYEIRKKLLNC